MVIQKMTYFVLEVLKEDWEDFISTIQSELSMNRLFQFNECVQTEYVKSFDRELIDGEFGVDHEYISIAEEEIMNAFEIPQSVFSHKRIIKQ